MPRQRSKSPTRSKTREVVTSTTSPVQKKRESTTTTTKSMKSVASTNSYTPPAHQDRMFPPSISFLLLFVLPTLVQLTSFACTNYQCGLQSTFQALTSKSLGFWDVFPMPNQWSIGLVVGFWVYQLLLHMIIPGYYFTGFPSVPDGRREIYKVNGLATYFITLITMFALIYYDLMDFRLIRSDYLRIVSTLQIFAFVSALVVYLKGVITQVGDPSGNIIVDFFFGYEPNPRFFGMPELDPKWFFEGRGLTLWMVFCVIFGYNEYLSKGHFSVGMLTALAVHFFYTVHYFNVETIVLNMKDFTDEHEGWALIFGMIVLVPVMYSMPEFYILENGSALTVVGTILICALYVYGYWIFAEASAQKIQFRTNRNAEIWGKKPEFILTPDGRGLLISGWWGKARKAGYTGDLIQCITYGLPAFAFSPIPFANFLFLFGLLVHREMRDHKACHAKHGKAWEEYCRRVPYRFIPYVY